MSEGHLIEHRGYLADDTRLAAYRAALTEVVRPGDVVLDLGSGTGLLGYLAVEAGAKSVVAVDGSDMIDLARRIAADNGYDDTVTHLGALSTETMLDQLADVIVCDQIGGMVHDAGILRYYADARHRLLAPGGRLVPAAFRVLLAPVTYDDGRRQIDFWGSEPASLDVSSVRDIAINTEWHVDVEPGDVARLATPSEVAAFDSDHDDPISGSVVFTIDAPGRLDGLLGWFDAQMSPSVTLSNGPWSSDRFERWCNFYPTGDAIDVTPGDRVAVTIDIRPRHDIVSWNAEVTAGGTTKRWRQSTFLAKTGANLLGQHAPVSAERVALTRVVLDQIDGTRTREGIVEALTHLVGPGDGVRFASAIHLESLVRRVTNLVD